MVKKLFNAEAFAVTGNALGANLLGGRHGQSVHNIGEDLDRPDPVLTRLGMQQSFNAGRMMKDMQDRQGVRLLDDVGLIVVSPMKRAMKTLELKLRPLIDGGGPVPRIIVDPRASEQYDTPQAAHSNASVIRGFAKALTIGRYMDFTLLEGKENHTPQTYESAAEVGERARSLVQSYQSAASGRHYLWVESHSTFWASYLNSFDMDRRSVKRQNIPNGGMMQIDSDKGDVVWVLRPKAGMDAEIDPADDAALPWALALRQ